MLFGQGTYKHIDGCKNNNRRKNIVSIRGYKNSGKIYLNGYIAIYMPEHKRAFKTNGCVYEHILIAERMLGRDLKNEECVHHIDYNRTNNSEDNLMIFLTNNDHVAYHGGANAIRLNDGTYMSDSIRFNYKYNNRTKKDIDNGVSDVGSITIIPKGYNLCPICKTNLKSNKANMCLECWNKEKLKNVPLKEELEKYIYNTSFVNIGKIFGVSDDTIRRWCKNRGLPYRRKDIEKIKVKGR